MGRKRKKEITKLDRQRILNKPYMTITDLTRLYSISRIVAVNWVKKYAKENGGMDRLPRNKLIPTHNFIQWTKTDITFWL